MDNANFTSCYAFGVSFAIITVMHNLWPHIIPYLLVSLIYLAVASDFWRSTKLQDKPVSLKWHSAMIAVGVVLHGWLLYRDTFAEGTLNFGVYYALSAIIWLTVLIYWLANLKNQVNGLQGFVLPVAALFVLIPAFAVKNYYIPSFEFSLFAGHVAIAVLAYSLFTFAALHALLMLMVERGLHQKTALINLASFPPIMSMESLLFKVITIGFTLLSLTLFSGMLFSEQIFGKALQFNHKVIFSMLSWLIYGWLLFGRYQYGWRGKKAINWSLFGFVMLLLAYVGSRFVVQVILNK